MPRKTEGGCSRGERIATIEYNWKYIKQKRKRGVFEGGEGKEIATIEYNWMQIKQKRKRGVFEGGEGKEIFFRIT